MTWGGEDLSATEETTRQRPEPSSSAGSAGVSDQQPSAPWAEPDGISQRRGRAAGFHRLRERIRARPALNTAYRTAVAVIGAGVIAAGVLLLPLPGPGWLIIFVGLGVLASEFDWARRLLYFARQKVAAWTRWVAGQSAWVRAMIGFGCLLVVAGCVVGYVAWQGVPGWVPFIG